MQDFHNKLKSLEKDEKRIASIKAKVAEVNSDNFDQPIVTFILRKQLNRHHELVRDGNGGFRKAIQPSFNEIEVLICLFL